MYQDHHHTSEKMVAMATEEEQPSKTPLWNTPVEKFEDGVIAVLASLLVVVIFLILAVVIYLFVINAAGPDPCQVAACEIGLFS
jgi:hypothetical protein